MVRRVVLLLTHGATDCEPDMATGAGAHWRQGDRGRFHHVTDKEGVTFRRVVDIGNLELTIAAPVMFRQSVARLSSGFAAVAVS